MILAVITAPNLFISIIEDALKLVPTWIGGAVTGYPNQFFKEHKLVPTPVGTVVEKSVSERRTTTKEEMKLAKTAEFPERVVYETG